MVGTRQLRLNQRSLNLESAETVSAKMQVASLFENQSGVLSEVAVRVDQPEDAIATSQPPPGAGKFKVQALA